MAGAEGGSKTQENYKSKEVERIFTVWNLDSPLWLASWDSKRVPDSYSQRSSGDPVDVSTQFVFSLIRFGNAINPLRSNALEESVCIQAKLRIYLNIDCAP